MVLFLPAKTAGLTAIIGVHDTKVGPSEPLGRVAPEGNQHGVLRTKSIDELREASVRENHFRRALHGWQLILLGIGCIVGTGIFVVTGTAAALHAGPAIAISFVISALGCLCAAPAMPNFRL
jgi:amino acid permease